MAYIAICATVVVLVCLIPWVRRNFFYPDWELRQDRSKWFAYLFQVVFAALMVGIAAGGIIALHQGGKLPKQWDMIDSHPLVGLVDPETGNAFYALPTEDQTKLQVLVWDQKVPIRFRVPDEVCQLAEVKVAVCETWVPRCVFRPSLWWAFASDGDTYYRALVPPGVLPKGFVPH